MSQQKEPLRLLVLDGGGVRGYSSLIILEQLMLGIQKHRKLRYPPSPCEIFDMIGGTSTGGIIALMLGRLNMSIDDVKDIYSLFSKEVFGKPKGHVSEGTYSATNLEKIMQDAVKKYGWPKDEKGEASSELKLITENDDAIKCKVFVCCRNANAMNTPRLFRSYQSFSAGEYKDMTIWQAARATFAVPTFFKRLKIGPPNAQEEFLDGGVGSNNPIKLLMEETTKSFDRQHSVACIISIGTGKPNITEFQTPENFQKALPKQLINALKEMVTDCETVEKEVSRRFAARPGIYFRFNVEHGLEHVPLEAYKELGNIKSKTINYLEDHKIAHSVDEAVLALCDPSDRLKVSDMKISFPSIDVTPHDKEPSRSEPVCVLPLTERISHFIGRVELLQELHDCFNGEDRGITRSVVVVLHAMGGQGKTQLALEYCERAKNENYDYILWANAEDHGSLEQSFAQFAKAKGMSQSGNSLELQALLQGIHVPRKL